MRANQYYNPYNINLITCVYFTNVVFMLVGKNMIYQYMLNICYVLLYNSYNS